MLKAQCLTFADELLKGQRFVDALQKDAVSLRSQIAKKDSEIRSLKQALAEQKPETGRLLEDKDGLMAEVAHLRKELEIRNISENHIRALQLYEQNKRLTVENNRLRDEVAVKEKEIEEKSNPGYKAAFFVDPTTKPTEIKLKQALSENKRLSDENSRLRAALDEIHMSDTTSRFKDQTVTGTILDGLKQAKAVTGQGSRDTVGNRVTRRDSLRNQTNATDEMKILSIQALEGK